MSKRLKIDLLEGWEDVAPENPDGPPTFVRSASDCPGVLQVSVQAEYAGGEKPGPTVENLVAYAADMVARNGGHVEASTGGECRLGIFGAVQGDIGGAAFARLWVLSNGWDFLLATHIGSEGPPDEEELSEGHAIIMNVDFR